MMRIARIRTRDGCFANSEHFTEIDKGDLAVGRLTSASGNAPLLSPVLVVEIRAKTAPDNLGTIL
jgi:hypothetical protein